MNIYLDWIPAFKEHFKHRMPKLTITELGKGDGTIWLAQNFKSVVSVEYTRYPFTAGWEQWGLKNHRLINIEAHENILELDQVIVDSMGMKRPHSMKDEAVKLYFEAKRFKGQVLFIDHGAHNRGEVLDIAITDEYYKYIAVHDINFPYYAYKLPEFRGGYKLSEYREGQGTGIYTRM